MANTKSSKKRIDITKRNRLRNRFYKSSVRTLIKVFLKHLEIYKISQDHNDRERAKKILSSVYSLIDKGAKKRVFHRNNAARKKSRLATYLKNSIIELK